MARSEKARSNPYTKGAKVPTTRFTVRLPADVNAAFEADCKSNKVSRSEVATRLIIQHLQQSPAQPVATEGKENDGTL